MLWVKCGCGDADMQLVYTYRLHWQSYTMIFLTEHSVGAFWLAVHWGNKHLQRVGVINATDRWRQQCTRGAAAIPSRLDLGVDPNKSTPVDLGIQSRVGSILLGAVEFKTKSYFSLALLQVDLNWFESLNGLEKSKGRPLLAKITFQKFTRSVC